MIPERRRVAAGRVGDGRFGAAALAVFAGALVSIRLDQPGWFDNEGRFAEVAREMIVLRDWITPRVNLVPLLTKPPLTQWLAALVFLVTGPSEWARLVSVGCAVVTIFLTCRIARRLYGPPVGLVAGAMLATMVGFVFEARTLRPDCLVIASVTAAVFCWHVAETSPRRTRWLVAMYATLGVGALAKGLVPIALAAVPVGVATVVRHGPRGLERLRPGLGLLVVGAVVLPWHVAAAIANPGFAWDYVVNQHLLFALDKKEPRDSEGDTLLFFWQAFLGRSAPWSLFAPFALTELTSRRTDPERRHAMLLLVAWAAAPLAIFSLTPSRLEHYSLPALPAVAILAARVWDRARQGLAGVGVWVWTGIVGAVLLAVGVFGLTRGRALAETAYWLPQAPGLMALVGPASLVTCWAGALFLGAALWRRATGILGAGILGTVPFLVILVTALIQAEALFSWRPVARALGRVPVETDIVFQAPVEYQIVGALDFYLRRPVSMLEPPGGYTPPTYLEGRMHGVFITREEFERRWRSGRPVALVSDPQTRRDAPEGLAPPPFHVLDRFGDRWVVTNFPSSAR